MSMPCLGLSPFLPSLRHPIRRMGFWVSMPYLGLSPFLPSSTQKKCSRCVMCQCPISGYPHFYKGTYYGYKAGKECVNALSRAIPISTFSTTYDAEQYLRECQCPISGYPHFYFIPMMTIHSACVNALSRAIPISTVTSRNPHKQGAQFRNNTCNCQTI